MQNYKGIGVSHGVAIGKAMLVKQEEVKVEKIAKDNPQKEIERFEYAVKTSIEQIEKILKTASGTMGNKNAQIFEAHLLMVKDVEMHKAIKDKINSEKINVEAAVYEVRNKFMEMLQGIEDEYMRERSADIKDVTDRILRNLQGLPIINLTFLPEEVILVAHDLTPSDTATMDKKKVIGFANDLGGKTSHTSIMARSMEIPAIVGLKDITGVVKSGDIVIIDGEEGNIYLNPDDETVSLFQKKKGEQIKKKEELLKYKDEKSVTEDGKSIEIAANIAHVEEVEAVINNGADGIGLYRTEFFYMNSKELPTEEEQFNAYKEVAQKMGGKPVIIRTMDIGGDKELQSLKLPKELNPFLGYRAIRICLDRKDLFMTQIRAILRASAYGKLKFMFPMISDLSQVRESKKLIEQAKKELAEQGHAFDKDIEIGIMIEIPAAAMISDLLAKEVDFFSIGTNDLIQYSIAVDRMNEKIAYLYNPLHPGVLRMLKIVVDNAHKECIWVGMCGEMAGDVRYIPLLIGMGFDELSMSRGLVLPARKLVSQLNTAKMKEVVEKVIMMDDEDEIAEYIKANLK